MDQATLTILVPIVSLLITALAAAVVKVINALGEVKIQLLLAQTARDTAVKSSEEKLAVIHDLTNSNLQAVRSELTETRNDLKKSLDVIKKMGEALTGLKDNKTVISEKPTEVIVTNPISNPVPTTTTP